MDFPTFKDLFRIGRDEVLKRSSLLTRAAVDRPGSDLNVDVAASAATADEVVAQLIDVASGVFLSSARGKRLDRLVFDRFGLSRKPAAPGLTSAYFQIVDADGVPAPCPATFTIPAGTMLQSTDGIQYITTGNEIYQYNSLGPVIVACRSVLAGANQQIDKDSLSNILGAVTGQPTSPLRLLVNNPRASAGADDVEDDPSLRTRARQFWVNARRGTRAAIQSQALATPGVRTAQAIEVLDGLGRPARYVVLIITDKFTDSLAQYSVVPPTYSQQSLVLTQSVFNSLDDTRCCGIYVQVVVASIVVLPVVLRLSFAAGVNIDQVASNARAAIVNYTNSLAPGQTWVLADAQKALRAVPGLFITGQEIASPAGDVVPKPLQALRTGLSQVLPTSLQGDQVLLATTNPDAFLPAAA